MINNLLNNLQKVKATKKNEWIACCPVHGDKTPSLAIKLTDEGKIICHCFGCGASGIEVVQSVGMSIEDLFPTKENVRYEENKRTYISAETVLLALSYEANIIALAACDIANKVPISEIDAKRILLANDRISKALMFIK